MRKLLLLATLTFLLSSYALYAQISFDKGYVIDQDNNRIECFIKDNDWNNNPIDFKYKLSKDGEIKEAGIDSIKEFGVYNSSKYVKHTVDIDVSPVQLNKLDYTRDPKFIKQVVFLKVLVEGKASLYYYKNKDISSFYFKTKKSQIEPLIRKTYTDESGNILYNNRYQQQLYIELHCDDITLEKINNTKYRKKELSQLFVFYNQCQKSNYQKFSRDTDKILSLGIRPGITRSSVSIDNLTFDSLDAEFEQKFGLRLGIEMEVILPFNKNKWRITAETFYRGYNDDSKANSKDISIKYSSIEVPIGVRHYFFINKTSSIFMNVAFVLDFPLTGKIEYSQREDLEIGVSNNFAFGLGYKYRDQYSLELRSNVYRDILASKELNYNGDYRNLSLVFGVKLF